MNICIELRQVAFKIAKNAPVNIKMGGGSPCDKVGNLVENAVVNDCFIEEAAALAPRPLSNPDGPLWMSAPIFPFLTSTKLHPKLPAQHAKEKPTPKIRATNKLL